MKEKFKKSDYPLRFINRKINEFWKGKYHGDERFLIPPNLFGIPTPFISIEIPYCQLKKYKSKHFLKKNLQIYRAVTTSKSRKVQPLFSLKCKSDYRLFGIYKGDCSCGSRYIGKTRHNADVRWNKHNNSTKSSEPSKHLRIYIDHYLTWTIISNAPKNSKTRKNLEASYIAL